MIFPRIFTPKLLTTKVIYIDRLLCFHSPIFLLRGGIHMALDVLPGRHVISILLGGVHTFPYTLLTMKWKPGLIPWIFKSPVNDAKYLIIYLSLLSFISLFRMALQSYTCITQMYLFSLIEVVGKSLHISDQIFTCLVMLGSTVLQNTTFVLILSSKSVSRGF